MGTNYYAVKNKPTVDAPIHIGKSSCGWLFHFQAHNDTWTDPPVVWNSYNQVKDWLKKYTVDSDEYVILDEYDRVVTLDELFEIIDCKQEDEENLSNPHNFDYYTRNVDGYRFSDGDFS